VIVGGAPAARMGDACSCPQVASKAGAGVPPVLGPPSNASMSASMDMSGKNTVKSEHIDTDGDGKPDTWRETGASKEYTTRATYKNGDWEVKAETRGTVNDRNIDITDSNQDGIPDQIRGDQTALRGQTQIEVSYRGQQVAVYQGDARALFGPNGYIPIGKDVVQRGLTGLLGADRASRVATASIEQQLKGGLGAGSIGGTIDAQAGYDKIAGRGFVRLEGLLAAVLKINPAFALSIGKPTDPTNPIMPHRSRPARARPRRSTWDPTSS
jgi:hypothetical protein